MQSTGSARLDYVVEQIWGPSITRGETRAIVSPQIPEGWEVREQFWAVPNARSAQLLVPHDRRVAARTLADYARLRPLKTRLLRRTLAAAVTAGAPLSTDSLRIIAPKKAPPTTVAQIGSDVGLPEVFATFGVRTAANAKPTLELRDPMGDAVGFVKLAWNAITEEAVGNEATAMATMGVVSRPEIIAPKLLVSGRVEGRQFIMTEPLPRGIRHVPANYSSLSASEALGPGTVHRRGPIGSAGQVQLVLAALQQVTSTTPGRLAQRAYALAMRVAATPVSMPIANFWHGDFVWWNTGRDLREQLWLFDWETAQPDAPAGLDTIHWYTHTKDAENPRSVVPRAQASLEHSLPLLRSLGHSRLGVAVLAAWYAVTLVANEIRLAESLESWERIKHSPEALEELLTWAFDRFELENR